MSYFTLLCLAQDLYKNKKGTHTHTHYTSIDVGQIYKSCHMTCQRCLHCCQPVEGSEGEVRAEETAPASGGVLSSFPVVTDGILCICFRVFVFSYALYELFSILLYYHFNEC